MSIKYVPPHLRDDVPRVRRVYNRYNKKGFFGDLQKSARIERYIFGKIDNSVIDFDDYDNIPIKINGINVPSLIKILNHYL